MGNFWMGIAAAQNAAAETQNAAAETKLADRGHRVLSIVGGIAVALLIVGGLMIAVALNG
jgi:hypothetical protein